MVIATCPGMISNGFAQSLEHPGGNVTGMDELLPGPLPQTPSPLKPEMEQKEFVVFLRERKQGAGQQNARSSEIRHTCLRKDGIRSRVGYTSQVRLKWTGEGERLVVPIAHRVSTTPNNRTYP